MFEKMPWINQMELTAVAAKTFTDRLLDGYPGGRQGFVTDLGHAIGEGINYTALGQHVKQFRIDFKEGVDRIVSAIHAPR